MISPAIVFLFLLSSWSIFCNATHEDFLRCMSLHSKAFTSDESKYIHTPNSSTYSSLLQSAEQNPRWLNSKSRKPLFIVTPFTESQIQASILCSRRHGMQMRVKSGGHDYEGLSFLCKTPFIILDLVYFRSISIDMEAETAWVQTGATLGELYYAVARESAVHGFPAGLCPSVGVGGHFSGGGIGTMMRKYGLAADNVIDACMINVNGRILDGDTMGEDLFWAIRGGGAASFGVIVAWKIKLVRVPNSVTVFTLQKQLDNGVIKLIHRWQRIAYKFPPELFTRVIIQNADGGTKGSNQTVVALFDSLFLGGKHELIAFMSKRFHQLGLKLENCIEMSWVQSVLYFAGYQKDQPLEVLLNRTVQYKSNFKAKSDFVTKAISRKTFKGIRRRVSEEQLVYIILDPMGGKMSEISDFEIPFPHRKGNKFNIQYSVKWVENDVRASRRHIEWMNLLYEYMRPYVSNSPRAAYINYRDLDIGINLQVNTSYSQARVWGKKYFKGNFRRLVKVKSKVDPDNFFRNEQSIPVR